MMEFLAANFNLPTIIVAAIVFGCVGWITWHSHKHGGGWGAGRKANRPAPFFRKIKVSLG